MVVAVLVSLFAPASRGLERTGPEYSASSQWASTTEFGDQQPSTQPRSGAGHKRKPFKAIFCLTSLASDFDVVSDWLFYHESFKNDHEYRSSRNEGDGSLPYLIPPLLISLTLVVCILSTIMWLILATDGRIIAPVLRRLGYDKLSIGNMLFLSVLVEDFPQVILTFLVEDYYEESYLSNLAVVNVTASLYDTLIKLAESYDGRYDIVETGGWRKESIWAHHDVVTSVVSLPLPPSVPDESIMIQSSDFQSSPPRRPVLDRAEDTIRASPPRPPLRANLGRRQSSVFDMMPIPMQFPHLRFLTASLDKTVRLWDTSASMKGHQRDKCIRVFRGHSAGVTCVALLGKGESHERSENIDPDYGDEEADHTIFFLSGCKAGEVKLWNLHGDCLHTYISLGQRNSVTAISSMKAGSVFVGSYQDGSVRLWEVWSGICLGLYKGHSKIVNCLCSMQDDKMFVTGSKDTTLKLWDTTAALDAFRLSNSQSQDLLNAKPIRGFTFASDQPIHEELICTRTFVSHSHPPSEILCVACIEKSTALVAGSADGVARLWAVDSGLCLRIFQGHRGPVTAIEAVDQVTILTGSIDTNVKVWDAVSGGCLRTYSDHSGYVSSISVAYDETTFLSASADLTVKIWVMTSVPKKEPAESLDHILQSSDAGCHIFLPE
jgi:WD40 repeat protein